MNHVGEDSVQYSLLEEEDNGSKIKNPEDEASIFALLTFSFVDFFIWNGLFSDPKATDIPELSQQDTCEVQMKNFGKIWKEQKKKSLLRTLLKNNIWRIVESGIIFFTVLLIQITTPILLNNFFKFLSDAFNGTGQISIGIGLTCSIFFLSLLKITLECQYYFVLGRSDVRIKNGLKSICYQKLFSLKPKSRQKYDVGMITNLLNIDSHSIGRMIYVIHDIWNIPLLILLSLSLSFYYVGYSSFIAFFFMLLMTPVTFFIGKIISTQTSRILESKDRRTKLMSEILKGIRVIKLFSWEDAFSKKISELREIEYQQILVLGFLESIQFLIVSMVPILSSVATFSFLSYHDPAFLTSANVFTVLSILNRMRDALLRVPYFITATSKGFSSVNRIQEFLYTDLIIEETTVKDETIIENSNQMIKIENGTFSWDLNPVLQNLNFIANKGELISIIGSVNSGKSSFLKSIFGEVPKVKGNLFLHGSISYCSQDYWILNRTIRENIVLDKPFDEEKYETILEVCGLMSDLSNMPNGDRTELGTNGFNISGGQKARIQLARCCYQDSDIYLLDSPLSALDPKVSQFIFKNCILGYLKEKTILFVSYDLQYLKYSDKVLIFDNGIISSFGTYDELMESNEEFNLLIKEKSENLMLESEEKYTEPEKHLEIPIEKLVVEETKTVGGINFGVVITYFKGFSMITLSTILFFGILNQLSKVLMDVWLSIWSSHLIQPEAPLFFYLMTYSGLSIYVVCSAYVMSLSILIGSIWSANKLHSMMLSRIFRASITFFDQNPVGRILNRFSKDQNTIDLQMPTNLLNAFVSLLQILSVFILITCIIPVFSFLIIPIWLLYFIWQQLYRISSREISRFKAVANSPVLNHITETVNGYPSIRAFDLKYKFMEKHQENVNNYAKFEFFSAILARWLAFRLELTGTVVIFCTLIFSIIFSKSISPALFALSITYAFSLTHTFNWLIKVITSLEQDIISVERILEYSEITEELPEIIHHTKPKFESWPSKGEIKFKHVNANYRHNLPLCLRDISLTIQGSEKIGVIGRTGSGKSSFVNSLFRTTELVNGKIEIDGIDISTIGLKDLRNQITIIPQDPTLFSLSIRENIDPTEEFEDNKLWDVLQKCHLKELVESLPLQLDSTLEDGGTQLSVGNRQLFCLCRALLKKTKIVIFDEVTSNVDVETEKIIQQTIQNEFSQSTVITIAHRLDNVINSSRILILQNGKVLAFDSPELLFDSKQEILSDIFNQE
eukprot:gene12239-5825_t